MVQPGHEELIHHMILYGCDLEIPDQYDGVGDMCYDPYNKAGLISMCTATIFGWAIGGNVSLN